VQVLEYIADVDAALAELHRALRPGGRAVVWDVDWATASIHSRDNALTTRVLRAWDEHLAEPSLPRTLGARLRSAGFEDMRVEARAFAANGGDPERFGAALVSLIATFVAGRQGISDVEAEAWAGSSAS
jgi:SAM-dependent methyltransferase